MKRDAVQDVRAWVERVVLGLVLCPFAAREVAAGRVRYVAADASDVEGVCMRLAQECRLLDRDDRVETTLIVLSRAVADFKGFLDMLALAEALLAEWHYEGVYQLASFHPDYCFDGVPPDDPANYTNRAPWPVLQLLREASVTRAVAAHPDAAGIPARNVERARELGIARMRALAMGRSRHSAV